MTPSWRSWASRRRSWSTACSEVLSNRIRLRRPAWIRRSTAATATRASPSKSSRAATPTGTTSAAISPRVAPRAAGSTYASTTSSSPAFVTMGVKTSISFPSSPAGCTSAGCSPSPATNPDPASNSAATSASKGNSCPRRMECVDHTTAPLSSQTRTARTPFRRAWASIDRASAVSGATRDGSGMCTSTADASASPLACASSARPRSANRSATNSIATTTTTSRAPLRTANRTTARRSTARSRRSSRCTAGHPVESVSRSPRSWAATTASSWEWTSSFARRAFT